MKEQLAPDNKNIVISERIAKRIARAGICSRREAEARIHNGRVTVNGKIIDSPALNVVSTDLVCVDNKPVPNPAPTCVWRYYKPRGLVVSENDEKNRETSRCQDDPLGRRRNYAEGLRRYWAVEDYDCSFRSYPSRRSLLFDGPK